MCARRQHFFSITTVILNVIFIPLPSPPPSKYVCMEGQKRPGAKPNHPSGFVSLNHNREGVEAS